MVPALPVRIKRLTMLDNWLKPIDSSLLADLDSGGSTFGEKIQKYADRLPNLKQTKVALIGIGEAEANAVRRALYGLSFPFGKLKIADLGNVRREENATVTPLLLELLDGKICPIVIGREAKFLKAQFEAHHACQPNVSLTVVDERLAFAPQQQETGALYLNPILQGKTRPFHFSAIGCQSHFMQDAVPDELKRQNFDCVRLGKLRSNLPDAEPFIRDADLVSFNLQALKGLEAPGVPDASPSGLLCEEACQLSRYAGMSDKLTSIGFYGFHHDLDPGGHTAQVLAQLIWYFLDGFCNRQNDFPASMNALMEYIVEFRGHDYQLTFWKSNKTGRWWLQVPVKTQKKNLRHRLIPCSYNDYLQASNGELPDRLLNAFKRFD
jgi:formiminoglutamase